MKVAMIILSILALGIILRFEYVNERIRQSQKSEIAQKVTQITEQRKKEAEEIVNTIKEINERTDKENKKTAEHQRILDKASQKLAQKGFCGAELLGANDKSACVSVTKEGNVRVLKIRFTSCGGAIIDDVVTKERILSF